jgi:hypothetical protein
MRRLFPAVLACAVAVVLRGVAGAQITLVPASPILVTQSPKFIATADFDRDGVHDVAVTNSTSEKVSVLFGSRGAGIFSSVIDIEVGRVLRGIAAADLNQDLIPDIAVVDAIDSRVFVIAGNGNGTFRRPSNAQVGLRPLDVAVGNFDGTNGNDLVTISEATGKATVLINQGGNRGFSPLLSLATGASPKRIEAADLNADGFDDIITINSGTAPADSVSVLLNTGVGASFDIGTNFVVNRGPVDMAITDVNNDGAPDILVLNAGQSGTANQFSVSVLINRTQMQGGRLIGTGFFDILTPVIVPCPRTIGGINVDCSPNFMAAGDLNNDGNVDFAVTFFTRAQNGGPISTAGLVEAFQGHGDGSFDLAAQVNVGTDPQGIAAADFTGDGIADLAVCNQGDRTVQLLNSLPPPAHGLATACTNGTQCTSGFCVDSMCCATASCPANEFCNIPGSLPGQCAPPADNGAGPCSSGSQCSSSFCVDEFCCGAPSCQNGEFCNTGQCSAPTANGTPCNSPEECASGFCTDGTCCVSATCPATMFCNIPGTAGQCGNPLPIGSSCTTSTQCTTGACADGVCCGSISCAPDEPCACQEGQACNLPGQVGQCANLPTPTMTLPPSPTPTKTPTPQPTGKSCQDGSQCVSTFCVDNTCCASPSCQGGMACNVDGKTGQCQLVPTATPVPSGGECTAGSQCQNGLFCTDGVCCGSANCQVGAFCNVAGHLGQCTLQPSATPTLSPTQTPTPSQTLTPSATPTRTPIPTATPVPSGGECTAGSQCQSGLFCTDGVCCNQSTCPGGQACNITGHIGDCVTVPTPTPTMRGPGVSCTPTVDNQCEIDLFCVEGVCCDSPDCAAPDQCDIPGFQGQCIPPGSVGDPCSKNSHCVTGLICSDAGECAIPPTATPTFIVFDTPPPTDTPDIQISRGGGCSVGDPNNSSGLWMLAAFPLILGIRRYQREQARARPDQGSR